MLRPHWAEPTSEHVRTNRLLQRAINASYLWRLGWPLLVSGAFGVFRAVGGIGVSKNWPGRLPPSADSLRPVASAIPAPELWCLKPPQMAHQNSPNPHHNMITGGSSTVVKHPQLFNRSPRLALLIATVLR
jgi:hypothetical protein